MLTTLFLRAELITLAMRAELVITGFNSHKTGYF